jgi:predicted ThiF/HesA family dinucleotide-utilizing enzyme
MEGCLHVIVVLDGNEVWEDDILSRLAGPVVENREKGCLFFLLF